MCILIFVVVAAVANGQIINIPDANFKNALVNKICADQDDDGYSDSDADTNNEGEIQYTEALAVLALFTGDGSGPPPFRMSSENESVATNNITDLTGIEYFLNIKKLYLSNNQLTTLDVSMLSQLNDL